MDVCKLKDGTEEADVLVKALLVSLNSLLSKGDLPSLLAVWDLRKLCDEPDYRPSERHIEVLKGLALLQPDGRMHSSVRNVVRNAVVCEGASVQITDPRAKVA